jgi:hypothetical protein
MKLSKLVFVGLLLTFSVSVMGCNPPWKKKDINEPQGLTILPAAPEDANLGILVSVVSTENFLNRRLPRLKVVTEADFDSTTGYKFLGRAYSNEFPGRRGFGIAVHEYFVTEDTPDFAVDPSGFTMMNWGYKYIFGMECSAVQGFGVSCPASANDIEVEPVFYSYSTELLKQGIVTLYQYETVGSVTSGVPGSGTVSFTTDTQEIISMQILYNGKVKVTPIGNIYHSTEKDRELRLQ